MDLPGIEVSLGEPSLSESMWLKPPSSQCFCPRYILFISEFLTCGTHFFLSTQDQLSTWKMCLKSHSLSVHWRNLRIQSNIYFYSEIFFSAFVFFPHSTPLSMPTPDTLVDSRVRCPASLGLLALTVDVDY